MSPWTGPPRPAGPPGGDTAHLTALAVLGTAATLVFVGCDHGAERAGSAPSVTVVIDEYSKDHTRRSGRGWPTSAPSKAV